MICLLILQKSAPDLTNVLLILIAIFASLLIISSLFNWLKSKPWHKNDNVESGYKTASHENGINESEQQNISSERTSETFG
jgi:hypothetical protein